MNVLIACERSGHTREAFAAAGHNTWSCDLQPSAIPGNHYQGDVIDILYEDWDLMICHPPCTYMSRAGARFYNDPKRQRLAVEAFEFAMTLWRAPIDRVCMENPYGKLWHFRNPDQVIHPYWFGHPYTKATCLWLRNLPELKPSRMIKPTMVNWLKWHAPKDSNSRSETPTGMSAAMANQWGLGELPPIKYYIPLGASL